MLFYFTATGNCLYVARKLENQILSIPQELKKENLHYKDEKIGIVTPVYAGELPQIVRKFIEQAHFDTGVAVGETLTDVIITVGPRAVKIAEGAVSVKPDMTVIMCENNREAIDVLKEIVKKEDAMMIKGSRSMKTDEIVKAFL